MRKQILVQRAEHLLTNQQFPCWPAVWVEAVHYPLHWIHKDTISEERERGGGGGRDREKGGGREEGRKGGREEGRKEKRGGRKEKEGGRKGREGKKVKRK